MEATTYIKKLRVSPKKLRFIAAGLKGINPDLALSYLKYAPQQNRLFLYKAIKAAISSSTQKLDVDESALRFKSISIESGLQPVKKNRQFNKTDSVRYKKNYC